MSDGPVLIRQLVRVCAWCKSYINEHGERLPGAFEPPQGAMESHGICIQCADKLMNGAKEYPYESRDTH